MKSSYNSILDSILSFLLSKHDVKGNFEKLSQEFNGEAKTALINYMEVELEIKYWKIDLILQFLEEEGHIVNQERIDLTLKGVKFIENGGYKENSIRIAKEKKFRIVVDLSLIFGGVFAGVYYLIEIWKIFFGHN